MILPIYLYGHPVLRAATEEVSADYPEFAKLVSDMQETMANSDGVGLAAPQVGKSIRLVVIDATPVAEACPETAPEDMKLVLVNPQLEVIEDVEPSSREEGCLSLPGLSEPVKRTEHVRLKWLDENFLPHEKEFTGFMSRIIQHEYDHLEGTVYMDRVAPIRKQLIRGKLNNLLKGKVKCSYRVKPAPHKK